MSNTRFENFIKELATRHAFLTETKVKEILAKSKSVDNRIYQIQKKAKLENEYFDNTKSICVLKNQLKLRDDQVKEIYDAWLLDNELKSLPVEIKSKLSDRTKNILTGQESPFKRNYFLEKVLFLHHAGLAIPSVHRRVMIFRDYINKITNPGLSQSELVSCLEEGLKKSDETEAVVKEIQLDKIKKEREILLSKLNQFISELEQKLNKSTSRVKSPFKKLTVIKEENIEHMKKLKAFRFIVEVELNTISHPSPILRKFEQGQYDEIIKAFQNMANKANILDNAVFKVQAKKFLDFFGVTNQEVNTEFKDKGEKVSDKKIEGDFNNILSKFPAGQYGGCRDFLRKNEQLVLKIFKSSYFDSSQEIENKLQPNSDRYDNFKSFIINITKAHDKLLFDGNLKANFSDIPLEILSDFEIEINEYNNGKYKEKAISNVEEKEVKRVDKKPKLILTVTNPQDLNFDSSGESITDPELIKALEEAKAELKSAETKTHESTMARDIAEIKIKILDEKTAEGKLVSAPLLSPKKEVKEPLLSVMLNPQDEKKASIAILPGSPKVSVAVPSAAILESPRRQSLPADIKLTSPIASSTSSTQEVLNPPFLDLTEPVVNINKIEEVPFAPPPLPPEEDEVGSSQESPARFTVAVNALMNYIKRVDRHLETDHAIKENLGVLTARVPSWFERGNNTPVEVQDLLTLASSIRDKIETLRIKLPESLHYSKEMSKKDFDKKYPTVFDEDRVIELTTRVQDGFAPVYKPGTCVIYSDKNINASFVKHDTRSKYSEITTIRMPDINSPNIINIDGFDISMEILKLAEGQLKVMAASDKPIYVKKNPGKEPLFYAHLLVGAALNICCKDDSIFGTSNKEFVPTKSQIEDIRKLGFKPSEELIKAQQEFVDAFKAEPTIESQLKQKLSTQETLTPQDIDEAVKEAIKIQAPNSNPPDPAASA